MKTIIACTDFSEASANACRYAALIAKQLHCKLVMFNMLETPLIHSNAGLYGMLSGDQKQAGKQKVTHFMNRLRNQFPELKIDSFVSSGSFKEELEQFVRNHHVEAAVMGLAAKDRISKYIYGSHGVDVAGKIDCPVIIVPSGYKDHQLAKVLLTVDNHEKILGSSLKDFEAFIEAANVRPDLLHVRTEDELFKPRITSLNINHKELPIHTIQAKDIQSGVRKYSVAQNIDLIAVISKKHSVFYDFFTESTTKKIAYAARVPVMAMHV